MMKKEFKRIKDKNGEFKILFDGVLYDEKLFIGDSASSNKLIRFIKDHIPESLFIPLRNGLNLLRKIARLNLLKILKQPNLKTLYETQLNEINLLKFEVNKLSKLYREDLLILSGGQDGLFGPSDVEVITEYPVAFESNDHIFPEGTANDDTRHPRFVFAIEKLLKKDSPISTIDIGCSGGGMVFDFLLRGHFAIGLEGSDYSLKAQRANWRIIPNHLFTCDVTKPFTILKDSKKFKFDLVTAWEFFEHIDEKNIDNVFKNIDQLIDENGFYIGSIGTKPSFAANGHPLHRTVQPFSWWKEKFFKLGYEMLDDHPLIFEDYCRGNGNNPQDPNFKKNPVGFHFVARKLRKSS